MGEVYRAKDTRLDRMVAVKVLQSHLSASPEVRQRFEREAKTISQLSQPHISALYDVGHQDGTDYLVMEYLEGETLSERLAKGALPLAQMLRFGVEIGDALDKAHRQGIVLDFGLARRSPLPLRESRGRFSATGSRTPAGARPLKVYSHTHQEATVRTNIVLDEELVKEAFRHSRARTKKALVHEALEELIRVRKRRSLLDLKGKVRFAKGYDYKKLRAAR
jgi:Arc/MetJ family transcription regulator